MSNLLSRLPKVGRVRTWLQSQSALLAENRALRDEAVERARECERQRFELADRTRAIQRLDRKCADLEGSLTAAKVWCQSVEASNALLVQTVADQHQANTELEVGFFGRVIEP